MKTGIKTPICQEHSKSGAVGITAAATWSPRPAPVMGTEKSGISEVVLAALTQLSEST